MKKIIFIVCLLSFQRAFTQELRQLAVDKPQAIADLKTVDGAAIVNAKWYFQPANLQSADFNAPGTIATDAMLLYPTGMKIKTHTIHPQVNDPDFEKDFKEIDATGLEMRKGMGLVSFVWFRVKITLPEQVGNLKMEGTTAVFEIVADDYSEIWVNGKQEHALGQTGNGIISGFNARNRVTLTKNAKTGDHFTIDILGINGPLGMIPTNYIWIRNAVIDFYQNGTTNDTWKNVGTISVIDTNLNSVITAGTTIDKIADGFQFTEGPVWHPDGFLLFSDPNTNTIYRYEPGSNNVSVYISHSGYTGADINEFHQPGSNGLAIDNQGRLIINQHGNRRVVRYEKKGPLTVLADKIDGKRLNSPNDLVVKSDGAIYFTDPPYGLPLAYKDRRKELDYAGVFMIRDGKLSVLSKDLGGPNGIAFSPDEKFLYVSNWDVRDIHHTKTLWRYEVKEDGTLINGKIFFDWNLTEDEEALDGIKVDNRGNLFVSAPGGVWILSSEAKLLGKITMPERAANMAWGDDDRKTLYLTAHTGLYKVRIATGGRLLIN